MNYSKTEIEALYRGKLITAYERANLVASGGVTMYESNIEQLTIEY